MTAAAQARHLSLARLERVAGQAFGYSEDIEPVAPRYLLSASSSIALATVATALAATFSYFV